MEGRCSKLNLSEADLKDRINQAVYDALDELETEIDMTPDQEAQFITDIIYDVIMDIENDGNYDDDGNIEPFEEINLDEPIESRSDTQA